NLLERVATLEERMDRLEGKQAEKAEGAQENIEESDQNKSKNTYNKNALILELQNTLAPMDINVSKASPQQGGGVLTKHKNKNTQKVMLRRSRNYHVNGYKWRGWHTIKAIDIDSFDGFIFSVENAGKLHFFVFNKKDFAK